LKFISFPYNTTGIFTIIKTLETERATQNVNCVLTRLLFNSIRSSSFIKVLDKKKKATSKQALERRLRKTVKSPRLRKKKQHKTVKCTDKAIKTSNVRTKMCKTFVNRELNT
jgi:hypothetical protein